jgi:uracil-DNA glycosylase
MKILFVGDCPSAKNISVEVAFVGTKSHKILLDWIEKLGCNHYEITNSHNEEQLTKIKNSGADKIIALGNLASARLDKLNLSHFKLPHPSGRNRLLNNKQFINEKLIDAKIYLTK